MVFAASAMAAPGSSGVQSGHSGTLADRVAAALRHSLAGYDVTVADAMLLSIRRSGKDIFQVHLGRISQICAERRDRCDATIDDYATAVAGVARTLAAPRSAAMLRAVVRTADYVSEIGKQPAGKPAVPLVESPFAGDIVLLCEFDLPTATQPVFVSDLKPLALSPSQAIETCRKNVAAALPPLAPQVRPLDPRTFGTLQGDGYTSSQFLFPEHWSSLARKQGGHLIVAVPGDTIVLYGRGDDPADIDAMEELAEHVEHMVERPISHEVFQWTPHGWQVVAGN